MDFVGESTIGLILANGGHHANYGKETRVESKRAGIKIELGSRDFRFQPDTGAIERNG